MKKEARILIELVKHGLTDKILPEDAENLTAEEINNIAKYAGEQGLFPFLQFYPVFLKKEDNSKLFQRILSVIYIDQLQMAEMQELLSTFERAGIYCIPLKGSRTKSLYPSSELRTMGDLDLLYKPEQTKLLHKVMESLGYHSEGEAAKHDHYRKGTTVVEMHRTLLSAQSNAYDYFLSIWERAIPSPGKKYIYEMTLEDHYLFTLYHLIEHFIRGGIGIRMVLDIFILSQLPELNWEYLNQELKILGIEEFEKNIRDIGEKWFSDNESSDTEDLEELEEYIIDGGIFGNLENERKNNMLMHKSKFSYLRSVVFPSYKTMKTVFVWLKSPLLLPVAWGVRAFRVWTKRRENIQEKIERSKAWKTEESQEILERDNFFRKYGL